jgi:hypothetical protein
MSMSNSFENGILLLLLNNTNFANIGDATGLRGSSTAGSLYVSLHTSDPGEAGTQETNEISYTGYARVALARSGSGWTVTANVGSPAANIDFGKMTAGAGGTVTHIGIGTASSGAGVLLLSGTTDPDITVANGVIPRIESTSTITFD